VRTVKLIVEYNGRHFHGWQKQPALKTVQSELERILSVVLRTPCGPLHAAGRTDAGVHARGQVVTFRTDADVDFRSLANGVSHLMKGELTVLSAEYAPEGFHPGISSTHKQYSYRILNRPTPAVLDAHMMWHIAQPIDLARMERDAELLVGTKDFSSLRDSSCTARSPVKTIYRSYFVCEGDIITYYVEGSGFLKQMVRNIVGTLTDIGRGRIRDRSFAQILAACDRRVAGVTAPAHGLCMDWVSYESVDLSTGITPQDSYPRDKSTRQI
jgi:tRNA pseudouridine38-40 synthase